MESIVLDFPLGIWVGGLAESRVPDREDISEVGVLVDEEPGIDGVLESEEDDVDLTPELFPVFIFSRRGGTVRVWTRSFGRGSGCFLRRSGRFVLTGLPRGMNSVLGVSLGLEDLMVERSLGSLGFL